MNYAETGLNLEWLQSWKYFYEDDATVEHKNDFGEKDFYQTNI